MKQGEGQDLARSRRTPRARLSLREEGRLCRKKGQTAWDEPSKGSEAQWLEGQSETWVELALCVHISMDLHKHWTELVASAARRADHRSAGVPRRFLASHPSPAVPHQQWVRVGCGGQTRCQPGPDLEFY